MMTSVAGTIRVALVAFLLQACGSAKVSQVPSRTSCDPNVEAGGEGACKTLDGDAFNIASADQTSGLSVTISWSPAKDASSYEVVIATDAECTDTYIKVTVAKATEQKFTLPDSKTAYYACVFALDKDGKATSAKNNGYLIKLKDPGDSTAPTAGALGTLATSAIATTTMTLTWTKATDDVSKGAALKYSVYQSASINLVASPVQALAAGTLISEATDISTLAITGLTPNTVYYFNVIVTDEAGNQAAYTAASASTLADTTAPTAGGSGTITTASILSTSLTLNWTKGTDDLTNAGSLKYRVYQSSLNDLNGTVTSIENNGTLVGTELTDANSLSVTSLNFNTTYYFNIVVVDSAGNKAAYTQVSATTAADGVAPTPGNTGTLTSASVATTSFTLNWTKATDNFAAQNTLLYTVYQSSTSNLTGTPTQIATNGSAVGSQLTDANTVGITGLNYNTTYYFNIVVEDPSGNKDKYTQITVTTLNDTTAPTPGNTGTITSASVAETSFTLSWTKATDALTAQAALKYSVYESSLSNLTGTPTQIATNGTLVGSQLTDANTLGITGIPYNATRYYNIVVEDAAGNKDKYTQITVTTLNDTTAPVPGNTGTLSSASVAEASFTLNWTKATDALVAQTALKYSVYQSSTSNLTGTPTQIATNGVLVGSQLTDANTVGITGLNYNATYYFNIVVEDAAGNKDKYTQITVTTLNDTTAPVPGGSGTLSSASVAETSFTLNWTKATDALVAQTGLKYTIYQSSTSNLTGTPTQIATNGSPVGSQLTDANTVGITGLSYNTTYYFNIVVEDTVGNKDKYTQISVTTLNDTTAPTPGNSGTITSASVSYFSMTLNWTKGTDDLSAVGALKYSVYQSLSNNLTGTPTQIATNGTLVGTQLTDANTVDITGLAINTTYYFNVVIEDAAGNKGKYTSVAVATLNDTTDPTVGTPFITLSAVEMEDGEVSLSWTKATDNAYSQSTLSYKVYYSSSGNIATKGTITNGTLFGTYTDASSVTITGLTLTAAYYFNILVTDGSNNSEIYTMRAPYCGGTGANGDEYLVCDPGSLQWVNLNRGSRYKQTADIDMSGTATWNTNKGFLTIADSTTLFTGIYDGQNYKIKKLIIYRTASSYLGLFYSIRNSAVLKNINIVDAEITGASYLGVLAYSTLSACNACIVDNCHTSGKITATGGVNGGLLAYLNGGANANTVVKNSSSSVDVVGNSNGCGGFVGQTNIGTIEDSWATGLVRCPSNGNIGGFVGSHEGGIIRRSYSTGFVRGGYGTGGFAGTVYYDAVIQNSYSTGNVWQQSIAGGAGGFAGTVSGSTATVSNSYATGLVYNSSTSDTDLTGGFVGITGATATISNSFSAGILLSGGTSKTPGAFVGRNAGTITNSFYFDNPGYPSTSYGTNSGTYSLTAKINPRWFMDINNFDAADLNWDFSSTGAWIMPQTQGYPVLRWQASNAAISFAKHFKDGRKVGASDDQAYQVFGYCSSPGATISFSGANAPADTTCNGGTWSQAWDLSGEADGTIALTASISGAATGSDSRSVIKNAALCTGAATHADFQSGSGTSGSPFIVCTGTQLDKINTGNSGNGYDGTNKYFRLGNNIDLSDNSLANPIGTHWGYFTGEFNGDGGVISNLTFNLSGTDQVGLFKGYVPTGTQKIYDLGVENVYVIGRDYTGGLSGSANNTGQTTLSNIHVTGFVKGDTHVAGVVGSPTSNMTQLYANVAVVSTDVEAGGIIGRHNGNGNVVSDSMTEGYIMAKSQAGGISGNAYGSFLRVGNYADVKSYTGNTAGGIVGYAWTTGTQTMTQSFNAGKITSVASSTGGLCGDCSATSMTMTDVYNTGDVFGTGTQIGGLVGRLYTSSINRGYNVGRVSGGGSTGGGIAGVANGAGGYSINAVFGYGSVQANSASSGSLVGQVGNDISVTNSYWYDQPENPAACIGNGTSTGTISCSTVTSREVFHSSSNAPLTLWDFTTAPVWKFPAGGGLPILNWQEE